MELGVVGVQLNGLGDELSRRLEVSGHAGNHPQAIKRAVVVGVFRQQKAEFRFRLLQLPPAQILQGRVDPLSHLCSTPSVQPCAESPADYRNKFYPRPNTGPTLAIHRPGGLRGADGRFIAAGP